MASLVVARHVRPLIAALPLVAGALLVPSLAAATPVSPVREPTISSVHQQLGKLALQNAQLVERYDQLQITVANRTMASAMAAVVSARAQRTYETAHRRFVLSLRTQYEGESFGAAGALLDSKSDANYIDRIDTLSALANQSAQVVRQVTASKVAAGKADKQARGALHAARAERASLAAKRVSIEKQIGKYKALLDQLTVEQRAAYLQASNPTIDKATAVAKMRTVQGELDATGSAAASIAVQFALEQVGKPYVLGSAGPDSFDCSGLTMAAWRNAGVSLPHSARAQYGYGRHVSRSELQPGDLIFFYSPIAHVTIYLGAGMMVSAPTEGQPVAVVSLSRFNSDYVGATRLI